MDQSAAERNAAASGFNCEILPEVLKQCPENQPAKIGEEEAQLIHRRMDGESRLSQRRLEERNKGNKFFDLTFFLSSSLLGLLIHEAELKIREQVTH